MILLSPSSSDSAEAESDFTHICIFRRSGSRLTKGLLDSRNPHTTWGIMTISLLLSTMLARIRAIRCDVSIPNAGSSSLYMVNSSFSI